MVAKDEAVTRAAEFLKEVAYLDRSESVVMLPETAIEFTYGWTVRFDFKEHIETGDFAQAPSRPWSSYPATDPPRTSPHLPADGGIHGPPGIG